MTLLVSRLLSLLPPIRQLSSPVWTMLAPPLLSPHLRVLGVCVFSGSMALTAALPGLALQVQVRPPNPQLGDTVSVLAQYDDPTVTTPPTVTWNGKAYPTFAVGANRFRTLLPTTPLESPGKRLLRVEGANKVRNLAVWVRNRNFPTQSIWLPPDKDDDGTDYGFDQVDAFKQIVSPQKLWTGPFLAPNQGPITTIYGVRRYYNGKFAEDYYHRGVDYAGSSGSPVIAPAAGRVALIGRVSDGFQIHGNTIGLDHGQGVSSIFLHLSRIDVKEGDQVTAGQVIGAVGSTGAATGPHLHWGLYVNGQSVDPVPWRTQGFD